MFYTGILLSWEYFKIVIKYNAPGCVFVSEKYDKDLKLPPQYVGQYHTIFGMGNLYTFTRMFAFFFH